MKNMGDFDWVFQGEKKNQIYIIQCYIYFFNYNIVMG